MSNLFKPGVNLVEQTIVHKDERGIFSNIQFDVHWSEINYVESVSSVSRGNHYHQFSTELFVILEGLLRVDSASIFLNANGKLCKASLIQHTFHAGQIFYISPMTWHLFHLEQPSKWFALMSSPHTSDHLDIIKMD